MEHRIARAANIPAEESRTKVRAGYVLVARREASEGKQGARSCVQIPVSEASESRDVDIRLRRQDRTLQGRADLDAAPPIPRLADSGVTLPAPAFVPNCHYGPHFGQSDAGDVAHSFTGCMLVCVQ